MLKADRDPEYIKSFGRRRLPVVPVSILVGYLANRLDQLLIRKLIRKKEGSS